MGNHWYSPETGEPKYTVIGANGKERDTTLADARKHQYVPSVTTILQIPSKPMLTQWLQNQLLEAVLAGRKPTAFKTIDQWKYAVIDASKKVGRETAERGGQIHDELEKFFTTGGVGNKWNNNAISAVLEIRPRGWVAEKSFAHPSGFGGRVDLYHPDGFIIDFKTKFSDGDKFQKIKGYDEHSMQLAAYEEGLRSQFNKNQNIQHINIYISTLDPGLIKIIEWKPEERFRGWKMFECLLNYWKLSNNIK